MDTSSNVWHVLVTGPTQGLEDWCAAAAEAGWRATPFPLVTVEATGTPAWSGETLPDWIAVTSSNALDALEESIDAHPPLGDVPVCCVGEATAQRATALGLREPVIPPPGAQDAAGLAATLLANVEPGTKVLWPRGDRARDFGARLQEAGLTVEDPIVYVTRPVVLAEEPPEVDAVFFASPSAVRAWNAEERAAAPAAIAIGWTTYEVLDTVAHRFSMAIPLATPSPQSFTACLRSFFPSE